MKITEVNDLANFKRILNIYDDNPNYIFRGQNRIFYNDGSNEISFSTSFERVRCTPHIMIMWNYYCRNAIKYELGKSFYVKNENLSEKFVSAMMQHYGYRSFFLDLTYGFNVACFFASTKYNNKVIFHLCEDANEIGLIDCKKKAYYIESDHEYSFVFVFLKQKVLESNKLDFFDLYNEQFDDSYRFVRQKSCLVACKNNSIISPTINEALTEVLKIKTEILLEHCKENNINQDFLFPDSRVDKIYNYLLSIPRRNYQPDKESIFFGKELGIPEYNSQFMKILPSNLSFYTTFWLSDNIPGKNKLSGFVYYRCFDYSLFFATIEDRLRITNLYSLLEKEKRIIVDFDNIFRVSRETYEYQKAIMFELFDNVIGVTEITVDVVGIKKHGTNIMYPRYYEVKDGLPIEVIKEDSCLCDDEERHLHLLFIGEVIAERIKDEDTQSIKRYDSIFSVTE